MALSQDGGLTYEEAHPMYTLADCGGLHGHIKVSKSGIVYVPNNNCGGVQGVIVSMDNGLTFSVQHVTGSTPGANDPSIGIGSKGRLYFGYTNGDGFASLSATTNSPLRLVVPYFNKFWDIPAASNTIHITMLIPPANQPGIIP